MFIIMGVVTAVVARVAFTAVVVIPCLGNASQGRSEDGPERCQKSGPDDPGSGEAVCHLCQKFFSKETLSRQVSRIG